MALQLPLPELEELELLLEELLDEELELLLDELEELLELDELLAPPLDVEVELEVDELVHWNPHCPLPQPPKQLPEVHEHGQFCGWESVQQDWELQPPEELEDEVVELEAEVDEELLLEDELPGSDEGQLPVTGVPSQV